MKKAEKGVIIKKLVRQLEGVNAAILVDYAGLSVANQRELKKRLREIDAQFIVVKNTLFKLAGKEAKYSDQILDDKVLVGQNALVLASGDPIKPLGVIMKFAQEFELPQIKVGLVEGFFQDKTALTNLAKLGGKEAIVAQLIGVFMAPTYQAVGVLEANLQSLVYILDQKSKK